MAKQSVVIVAPDQSTVSAVQALIQDQFEVSTALWTTESLLPIHEQASSVMLLDIDSPSQPSAEDGLNILQQLRQTGYAARAMSWPSLRMECNCSRVSSASREWPIWNRRRVERCWSAGRKNSAACSV
ncbi:MAG: hypothetical protein DYH03_06195 [Nitrospira sp. NTP1]|nr:hypothetical protein [Nitrospira sp. NTP1]